MRRNIPLRAIIKLQGLGTFRKMKHFIRILWNRFFARKVEILAAGPLNELHLR